MPPKRTERTSLPSISAPFVRSRSFSRLTLRRVSLTLGRRCSATIASSIGNDATDHKAQVADSRAEGVLIAA